MNDITLEMILGNIPSYELKEEFAEVETMPLAGKLGIECTSCTKDGYDYLNLVGKKFITEKFVYEYFIEKKIQKTEFVYQYSTKCLGTWYK